MKFIEATQRWVGLTRAQLGNFGEVLVRASEADRPKQSIHIVVQRADRFVEMILWESGEAEFSFGDVTSAVDEHHDLVGAVELQALLDRLAARARELQ